MLPNKRKLQGNPTTEVAGGFPVHFHYTAGIANEKFFNGLKDQKLLANTCDACEMTYLPPKMFCEKCMNELDDATYKEAGPEAEIFSFTQVFHDHRGDKLDVPFYLALLKVDGTDSTFFHTLVDIEHPSVGMKVKPVWNDEREGSLFDLKGFTQ